MFVSSNMAAIFFESGTRTLFSLLFGLLISPSRRPSWFSSSFSCFGWFADSSALDAFRSFCGFIGMGWKVEFGRFLTIDDMVVASFDELWKYSWFKPLTNITAVQITHFNWLLETSRWSFNLFSSYFWLMADFSWSSSSTLVCCSSISCSWSFDSFILLARNSASISPILSIRWSRSLRNIWTFSLLMKFNWLWNDEAPADVDWPATLRLLNFW